MTKNTTYDYTITIRNKKINFRKWKVKDRKRFIQLLQNMDTDVVPENIPELVYNCLENKNTILSKDEFRYVLTQIRKVSIGDDITFELDCEKCHEEYDATLKIDDIVKPQYEDYRTITIDDISISLGDAVNKEFYDEKIQSSESAEAQYMNDFLLHINKINNNDTFTFNELEEYVDDMDIDTLDKILDEWDKIKFSIDDVSTTKCTHCGNEDTYSFDELPGFFPDSWFNRK